MKLPVKLVLIVAGLVVTGTVLYLMVIAVLALNPVPLTVMVVPEDPLVGVMVILWPTAKVAVA